MKTKQEFIAIACSVLKQELGELTARGIIDFPIQYLTSSLHMHPDVLQSSMAELLERVQRADIRILLIYGDCHPYMDDCANDRNVVRTKAINCAEMLLGKMRYKSLIKEGAFLFLPEWTCRWREILNDFPGVGPEIAADLLRRQHSRLVYLDTGVCPVPHDDLTACGAFIGLPWEVMHISLDNLAALIREAMEAND